MVMLSFHLPQRCIRMLASSIKHNRSLHRVTRILKTIQINIIHNQEASIMIVHLQTLKMMLFHQVQRRVIGICLITINKSNLNLPLFVLELRVMQSQKKKKLQSFLKYYRKGTLKFLKDIQKRDHKQTCFNYLITKAFLRYIRPLILIIKIAFLYLFHTWYNFPSFKFCIDLSRCEDLKI